jgi:hypothetical protein
MQRARDSLQFRRSLDDRQSCAHRALGVVLMRLGVAEIGQHAVAHVLGDEAAIGRDQIRAALVIGADDPAHVLRIELRRKRGRADEIAEHDGQLATFGRVGCGSRNHGQWGA